MIVITSSLSLARQLWRYGEPELADRMLALSPADVYAIGVRAGELLLSGEPRRIWPDGPKYDAAPVLAAIERLEGEARPCAPARRLPETRLPPHLQATEQQRWAASQEVAAVGHRLNAMGSH